MLFRLHPAVKLAWLLWATIVVFIFASPVLSLVLAIGALLLLWLHGRPPWRVSGLALWFVLGLAIFVAQTLTVRSGEVLWGPVTTGGIEAASRSLGRLLAVVLTSSLFVATTEPVLLAQALMNLGLSYRWGFALITALRLAPIFRLEAHHVYRAQLIRGVACDHIGPARWGQLLRHLGLPLVVSALRTAHNLALSMEGRAFGLHPRRTSARTLTFGLRDLIAMSLLVLSLLVAVWRILA